MRRCHSCGQMLPVEEFYRSPAVYCKPCHRTLVSLSRWTHRAYYLGYEHSRALAPHRVAARLARKESVQGRIDRMVQRLRERTC
jgi:hypothetical protein